MQKPSGIDQNQWSQLVAAGWTGFVANRESAVTTYGGDALEKFVRDYKFNSVFDLGCGEGIHTAYMRNQGKSVTSLDIRQHPNGFAPDIVADYMTLDLKRQFDAIWCSHVLEHMPDPQSFLKKVLTNLTRGGALAITVPPLKHAIVDGHINLFNTGTLLYRMVIAGLDCSKAAVSTYGYNISVLVEKREHGLSQWTPLPELAKFFPVPVKQAFEGRIKSVNW